MYPVGVMAENPGWVPRGVDPKRANVARVYDYLLGGNHHFLADQDLGRSLAAVDPNVRVLARANRDFLGRAVRFLATAGIGQFLDIGSGIPTQGNAHEAAQAADPRARVVYADIDPVAVAHSQAILAGNLQAAIIEADLREPGTILGHPLTRQLIDFSQPAGLLLVSVLPFLAEDPWRVVAALRDALAPGSYLAICHATSEGRPAVTRAMDKVYRGSVSAGGTIRSRPDILRFFDGFELVEPGLVNVPLWRPVSPADVPADPDRFWVLAGVGRKP
jgi:SAM-dependent methyltransferase